MAQELGNKELQWEIQGERTRANEVRPKDMGKGTWG